MRRPAKPKHPPKNEQSNSVHPTSILTRFIGLGNRGFSPQMAQMNADLEGCDAIFPSKLWEICGLKILPMIKSALP
jgi:hypothetical protein